MKTLVTDGFENEIPGPGTIHDDFDHEAEPEAHNIVYGALGFTDALDDATIALLVSAGVIVRHREIGGPGWQTRIYLSVQGNPPK